MSSCRVVLVLVLVLGAGCASEHRREDEAKARGFARQAMEVRGAATAFAVARLKAADDRQKRPLELGEKILQWFEEAELTLVFARQYYEAHDSLDLPEPALKQLDAIVERMTALVANRLRQKPMFPDPGPALEDQIESERLALRAYRTALGLMSQGR